MATMLRKLRVKRIDLVDKGANYDPASGEGAHVLLFKSADCDCAVCKAELGGQSRGEMSDADFAAVWTDSEGRKQRKLPIHDAAHVRNALARFNQTEMPAEVKAKAKAKLEAAKHKFNIGDEAAKMQPTSTEVNVDEMARCKKCDTSMKKGTKVCPQCGAEMEPDADDTNKAAGGRPKEDAMADEKLKADLDAACVRVDALTKERDELQKRVDAHENTPEAIEKRRLEALPESIRKTLVEQGAEIQKLRDEKAEAVEIAEVKKAMPALPGKPEDTGKLLKRAKDLLAKEDYETLTVLLKAASAQIEKGKLFREVGNSGDGEGDEGALAKINRMIAERISKSTDKKLTRDQALQELFSEQPDLYVEYTRSVTVGSPNRGDAN